MTPHSREVLRRFKALDKALVEAGFPATSPWWMRELERFYSADGRYQWVIRAGRRGGKSTTLCRLAVTEALYGAHDIPRGTIGRVMIVAQDKDEAADRIQTIKDILNAIKVGWHPVPDGIGLNDKPIEFKVFASTVKRVRGKTSICIICDEVAYWLDDKSGANPATEVLAAIRPTMATMPNAKIVLSSSPYGRHDAHYKAFEEGEDPGTDESGNPKAPYQITSMAVSWVANPTLTEERTKQLEPDPVLWSREYACIPGDDKAEGILSAGELDRVIRTGNAIISPEPGHEYWAAMDPATSGNAWTFAIGCMRWGVVTFVDPDTSRESTVKRLKRTVVFKREWRGSPSQPLRPKAILQEMRTILLPYGLDTVYSDEWSFQSMYDLAADVGLTLVMESSQVTIKRERYRNLAIYVRSQQVDLPLDEQMRQDILNVRRRITATGERIELATTPDGRHADYAPTISLLLTRPMSEPKEVLDDAALNLERKRAKYEALVDDAQRPNWKPKQAVDRGDGAFWRPR